MMMNGEFRRNLNDVTGQSTFDASISGHLPNAFNLNSGAGQNEALLGLDSGSADSLHSRGKALSKQQADTRKRAERSRKSSNDVVFLDLLQRAQRLEKEWQDDLADLEAKYGENVIDGMAAAILSEEELKSARTDDEKMQAMADKMLNPDGSIKPEWRESHPEEARNVQKWQAAQEAKALANNRQAEYESASPERRAEMREEVSELSYEEARSNMAYNQGGELSAVAAEAVEDSAAESAEVQANASDIAGLNFGGLS